MGSLIWGIIWSLLPIAELRVGIPIALGNGLDLPFSYIMLVYFACVIANILVFPIVFTFLNTAHYTLMKWDYYRGHFERFLERVHSKTHDKVEKYGYIGLTLFVMVPLPVTGAYTGTVAAWFFGMNRFKAFLSVSLGVAIAGLIITTAFLSGAEFIRWVL